MSTFRYASIVSLLTGLSRFLGLLREIAMAAAFGTSLAKSAFDVAFRIPNLFRSLLGEGALSAAFIPVFTETLEKEGRHAANRLSGRVATLLGSCLIMITVSALILISFALKQVSEPSRSAAVLPLLRILFPFMIFICLVALCMGILNAVRCFAVPAAAPVILNVLWIAAVIWVCPHLGESPQEQITGVAWAVLFAGGVELLAQLPALKRHHAWPVWSFQWRDPRIARILQRIGPVALGMGVHQLNVVVDGLLALWIGSWAPAALTYADRLVYLPLGVFTTALATVLLPAFSRQVAAGRNQDIPPTMSRSLQGLLLIITPAAIGLAVLAGPIVQLVFEYGQFDARSTLLTSRALRFYAPGLLAFSLVKLLVPAFYAVGDTKTPLRIGMLSVGLNFILNLVFVITLPTEFKHAGLALATVIASTVNGTLLAILLSRRLGSPGWTQIGRLLLRVLCCCALMAAAALLTLFFTQSLTFFTSDSLAARIVTVVSAGGAALAVYLAGILIFCRREFRTLVSPQKSFDCAFHDNI